MTRRTKKKTRFSDIDDNGEERSLLDILEMAQMYQERGQLSRLPEDDEKYLPEAVTNFSRKSMLPRQGSKRVLKLVGLLRNAQLMEFLKTTTMLKIFAEQTFTKQNGTISQSGGTLCLELLEAFVNGKDPSKHESGLPRRKRLNALALEYDSEARDTCVVVFFKIVSVIATLCSFVTDSCFMTDDGRIRDQDSILASIVNILSRFLSKKWLTPSMQSFYSKVTSPPRMVEGWILVTEVMKVQLQELWYREEKRSKNPDGSDSPFKTNVTKFKVLTSVNHWCHHVVAEFGACIYSNICAHVDMAEFVAAVEEVLREICHQLMAEIGSLIKTTLPSEILANV